MLKLLLSSFNSYNNICFPFATINDWPPLNISILFAQDSGSFISWSNSILAKLSFNLTIINFELFVPMHNISFFWMKFKNVIFCILFKFEFVNLDISFISIKLSKIICSFLFSSFLISVGLAILMLLQHTPAFE